MKWFKKNFKYFNRLVKINVQNLKNFQRSRYNIYNIYKYTRGKIFLRVLEMLLMTRNKI